jgi:integrase/recombinase XerC
MRKKTKKYALTKDKFLSNTEVEMLYKTLSLCSDRDRLLVLTAINTGARATELLSLTKKDLNPSTKSIFIRGIKGSDDREIPLNSLLFGELQSLFRVQNGFSISYPRLVQIWNEVRPVNKTFHSLRHTFAFRLYASSKDILLVQQALGHRSIHSTMIYSKYQYNLSELRRVLDGGI